MTGHLAGAFEDEETARRFIAWADQHDRWCFVVAEARTEICGKPREAAIWVLAGILEEIHESSAFPSSPD